jgi:hypothetical protein
MSDVFKELNMWELALDDLRFEMYRLECLKDAPDRAELRASLEKRIEQLAREVRAATDGRSLALCC